MCGIVKNAGFKVKSTWTKATTTGQKPGTVVFITAKHTVPAASDIGFPVFTDNDSFTTLRETNEKATATNAIDTDGTFAGVGGGTNVEFTINVPSNAGGEGGIVTIVCQDDDDTGDTGKGANKIVIGGNSGLGDPSWQDLILAAINGTANGRITYATSGR